MNRHTSHKSSHISKTSRPSFLSPRTLTLLSAVCFIIFTLWVISVVVPVIMVEATYAYKIVLKDVLHVRDIRQLFVPNIQIIDPATNSSYKEYGITIPSIFLDEPVVFNVDPNDEKTYAAALKQGIAHASGTDFPGGGGLGYYFAHSSQASVRHQYNAVFYLLGKLKAGDAVNIWHEGARYKYTVRDTRITNPSDVSFLDAQPDKDTIVLQTCWPPGTTWQRLLVFAEYTP